MTLPTQPIYTDLVTGLATGFTTGLTTGLATGLDVVLTLTSEASGGVFPER